MWVVRPRQELPSVVNLENGHYIGVRSSDDTRGQRTWEIVSSVPTSNAGAQVIMDGYKTFEDAEKAFKDLLSHLEIEPFETDDPTVVPADAEEVAE